MRWILLRMPLSLISLIQRHKKIIGVTPGPVLAGLRRGYDWVAGTVIMFSSMFLRRRIAAMGFAAGLAGAQVYPGASHGHTLLALVRAGFFYFLVLRQMDAVFGFQTHAGIDLNFG